MCSASYISLHVCMNGRGYIYIYICIHVYMYVYMYRYIHIYIYISKYKPIYTYGHTMYLRACANLLPLLLFDACTHISVLT